MKITSIDTITVGAGWKNWLFIRVNAGPRLHGVGEGTLNGFIRTTEAAVRELEHLAIGQDPRNVNALSKRLMGSVSLDGGHIHRAAVAAIETACWDILGKSLGAPIHQLLGGKLRDSVLGYGNGWYRTERSPKAFVEAAEAALSKGFHALKLDPFGTAQEVIESGDLHLAYDIVAALRSRFGPDLRLLIDVHARFMESDALKAADKFAPLDIYWWEEPTTREREQPANSVAARCPIRVATGEMYDTVGQFYTLAERGGVNIFQPEPMSLGGISNTLAVANLALAHGSMIAPHQSGGPIATAVCLHLAACVPNFLIQEHFDPFNEPWTRDLVTWAPSIDPANGHLSLPSLPGLGVDLNFDVAEEHPYDPSAYLNIQKPGWEKRLGQAASADAGNLSAALPEAEGDRLKPSSRRPTATRRRL